MPRKAAIELIEIEIKTPGRKSQVVKTKAFGEANAGGRIITDKYHGADPEPIIEALKKLQIDPAQALVEGANVLLRDRAIKSVMPNTLSRVLLERGMDPTRARIGGHYGGKFLRELGLSAEDLMPLLDRTLGHGKESPKATPRARLVRKHEHDGHGKDGHKAK